MKKTVVLVLVLIVVFSSQLFSETLDCQQSFELGKHERLPSEGGRGGWGLLGLGLTGMGSIVSYWTWNNYDEYNDYLIPPDPPPEYFLGIGSQYWFLIGPGIGTAISIVLPLAIKPRPKVIPANISEDQLNCYLDGYKRTARRKNVTSVLIGCAAGWVVHAYMVWVILGP